MTLKKITIENIKGIESKTFDLDIIPNRPSILVAPNGFGKSSIAAAFLSLQTNRIALHDDHHHQGDATRTPRIIIEYVDDTGTILPLEANNTSNAISAHFDYFVINNQVKAKGIGRTFGGRTNVSASMTIEPVVLVDTVPERELFEYSYRGQQTLFGKNGKMLPNIGALFDDKPLVENLSELYTIFDRMSGTRVSGQVNQFKQDANAQNGSATALLTWMAEKIHDSLDNIEPLRIIAELLLGASNLITSLPLAYLAAIQVVELYSLDKPKFKKACKYSNYKLEREQYASVLTAFNSSWRDISPQERRGQLIVEFPIAHHISNGQRDVLSFVALLHRARRKLRKQNSILIIDEVFDYLDDANLIAVQYYITELIEDYHNDGKKIYPLILTHLNPYYFKNFVFSKQKNYFLDKRNIVPNASMVKLLRNRQVKSIEDDVSKYLLHFHSSQISRRDDFRDLGLRETWGESDNFYRFIQQEMDKYRIDQADYDPFAICCAVRNRIEKLIHDKLTTPEQKAIFLDTHLTREKLEYAEEVGVLVPEFYYLLGIIYNEGMHWRENQDNVSPIASKLENCTIANLIKQLY